MNQIYKRNGSNNWYVSSYVRDRKGKLIRKRQSLGTTDEVAAHRKARELFVRFSIDAVDPQRPQEITLSDAFDLLTHASKHRSAKTQAQYDLARRKALGIDIPRLAVKPYHFSPDTLLSDLSTADLDAFIAARKDEGLTSNSINVELRVLRRVVKLAHQEGYFANVKLRFKMQPGAVRCRKFSQQEEAQIIALLDADGGESAVKARDLFIFLLDTGVRLNEALDSHWCDYDLSARSFEVHRSKTSSVSSLFLTSRVHAMLLTKAKQPMPFFEMDRAVKVLRSAIDDVCNTPAHAKIIARDGRAVIHSCRDTFATRVISKGLTLYEGSKLLGHTTQHMTAKYSHLESRDVAARAAHLLEQ